MSRLKDAKRLLESLQVPQKQQSDVCCYALLALAGLKKRDKWALATNEWLRIHDMIAFIRDYYGVSYAENSRETLRKQALQHFRNAAFIEDNGKQPIAQNTVIA